MKQLYFDCFAGASGNMILGALIDAGVDADAIINELKKLNLPGYEINIKKKVSKGITGTNLQVNIGHDHSHRGLKDIFKIIDESSLSDSVKSTSKKIFTRLGEAEAEIHNKTVDEIHFHEVGAVDAIIDIVGSVIAVDLLGVDKIRSSKIHIGTGTLKCAHGIMPVPAPATLKLLVGAPVYSTGIESELVTPTGAVIITTLCNDFGAIPAMIITNTGFGMGDREINISNFLRVVIGEESVSASPANVQMIETNIDDMNPEFYEHVMECLFNKGAKDVFMTQVIMKKNRPGVVLSVIAEPKNINELIDIIFEETSTLGVRISEIKKRVISLREIASVKSVWGPVRVKIKTLKEGRKTFAPEYDDCKKIASKNNIPISSVFDEVKKIAETTEHFD